MADNQSANLENVTNNAEPTPDQASGQELAAAPGELTAVEVLSPAQATETPILSVYVGPEYRRFTFDLYDLRRESRLFRQATCITTIELRDEEPVAFQLIHNWFSGNVGYPPITRGDRARFLAAVEIAKQLGVTECESQLAVILHKATAVLAEVLFNHMNRGIITTSDVVTAEVYEQMRGYMIRSPRAEIEGEIEELIRT